MDEPTPVDLIPRGQALAAIETFTRDMAAMADQQRQQYLDLERKYERSAARLKDFEWMVHFDQANPLLTLVKATPQTPEQKEKRFPEINQLELADKSVGATRVTDSGALRTSDFTRVFHDHHATNAKMFDDIGRLVWESITGRSFLLLAYGGTGSGKTYTILQNASDDPSITQRTIDMLYDAGCTLAIDGIEVLLLENDRIVEIGGSALHISPSKPWSLKYTSAESWKPSKPTGTRREAMARIELLSKKRKRGSTKGNSESSRSHGIFDLQVYDSQSIRRGRLTFVDLPGLEDSPASTPQESATSRAMTPERPTFKAKASRKTTPGAGIPRTPALRGGRLNNVASGSNAPTPPAKKSKFSDAVQEKKTIDEDLKLLKEFLIHLANTDRARGQPGVPFLAQLQCRTSALNKLLSRTLDVTAGKLLPGIVFVGFILTHGDTGTGDRNYKTLDLASQIGTKTVSGKDTPAVRTQGDGPALLLGDSTPGEGGHTADRVVMKALKEENRALRQLLSGIKIDHDDVASPDVELG